MSDLRKAAEAVLEAWSWDWSEPRNKALRERMEALRQALAKSKEQGVITYRTGYESGYMDASFASKREWVGLTDEEVESWRGNYDFFDSALVKEVEAKLKEKNA